MKAWTSILLASVLTSPALSQSRPDPSKPADRARLEPGASAWLKANAIPFGVDVPTPAELKPLMEAFKGARVVGFGESTHGDHQSQLFKTHAIREMVRQGQIDALMLEINRVPGAEFDTYVNKGKGDLATLIMESKLFGIWRTDEFASLILWLRGYVVRTGKPFRVYGIDCQDPSGDFDAALKWLERVNRREARDLRKVLDPLIMGADDRRGFYPFIKTQTRADYTRYLEAGKRLERAIAADRIAKRPSEGLDEAAYAVRVGIQSLVANELDFAPEDTKMGSVPVSYVIRRDLYMGQNLLDRLGDRRAALWAHDMHTVGTVPGIAKVMGFQTVGTEVRKTLGDAYVAVGFAWTEGSFRARLLRPEDSITDATGRPFEVFQLENSRPGDLGEFLGRVGGDRWYADLRTADKATRDWGLLDYYRGWVGSTVDPKKWQAVPLGDAVPVMPSHDILVYTRRIGPSNTWQIPPKGTPRS